MTKFTTFCAGFVALAAASLVLPWPVAAQTDALATPSPAASAAPRGFSSMIYHAPAGWLRMTMAGARNVFVLRDGNVPHVIVIGSQVNVRDVDAYASAAMAKWSTAAHDDGTFLACDGLHSHHWTVSVPLNGLVYVEHFSFVPIYNGVGLTVYMHPKGTPDRPEGLAAEDQVCPGQIPFVIPTGWLKPEAGTPDIQATSPDGSQRIAGMPVPLAPAGVQKYEDAHPLPGAVKSQKTEPCGRGTVQLLSAATDAMAIDAAYVDIHGIFYHYRYERPLVAPADPVAEAALTAMCSAPWPYPPAATVPDATPAPTFSFSPPL